MRTAVVGGGPGGLYFAALMKQLDPAHEVVVWERNAAEDTFGFGVVFSDETVSGITNADPVVSGEMNARFAQWTDIDIHYRGEVHTVGGQGFAAMARKELLQLLQQRCLGLGVDLRFRSVAPPVSELSAQFDLVLAADGVNSAIRTQLADHFGPTLDVRRSEYMWLGTDQVFEAFKFFVKTTRFGVMQVHGYPYSSAGSTFIVEMHPDVWQRAGFAEHAGHVLPPGVSDERSIDLLRDLFADELGGFSLTANNSKWLHFTTVRNEHWSHGNIVLLGDAAHTAHFSIGSGTKLAMEDALALAACLHEYADIPSALAAYETERRPVVLSTQRAAQASLEWFEDIAIYAEQEPVQFCFNLLTRSRRITFDNLKVRDTDFARRVEQVFARQQGAAEVRPAMFQPGRIGGLDLKNRIIVSSMDMYSAVDGVPGDFHLAHLGSKALGGAGLVMTEMVCVSPEGRITLGCTGLYDDEQTRSWQRIVRFVHESSTAKIGVQLGHSGRKGSTRLLWEGMDAPLADGGWQVVGPSAVAYGDSSQVPRELDRSAMDEVRDAFVEAARNAATAGFDLLELHAAHGYLLSSFLSPLANRRQDEYGGSLDNRLRFPLKIFDAVRVVWPEERPMTVRVSATDWAEGGLSHDESIAVARAFIEHGAAGVDVSTGQVVESEQPAFGRSYQTPYADRIRNRVARDSGAAVIAVGVIASYDDVNSILLAGRADFCALGRSQLFDPQWTLHAAADQDYRGGGADWPLPFRAGSRKPPTGRTDAVRPRLELLRTAAAPENIHVRWTPDPAAALAPAAAPAPRSAPAIV